ncbi:MAG: hypothetical protein LBC70_07635 [Chitinispirillales bacterium]|nr:hypothetical protein [Chitinispirillales bacterium]
MRVFADSESGNKAHGVFYMLAAAIFSVLVLAGCGGTNTQKTLAGQSDNAHPKHETPDSGSAVAKRETGTPDTEWYIQNPGGLHFTISTADELAGLADIVNGTDDKAKQDNFSGKTVRLTRDIDLSGYAGGEGWVPIGDDPGWGENDNPFSGMFDGGGHVISNLTINRPNALRQGLFGNVTGGKVANVGLNRVNIHGGTNVGGVVGGLRRNSSVTNAYSTGVISGNEAVGGIAGEVAFNSNVADCYSAAAVSGIMHIGGVAGYLGDSSAVASSYSAGAVTGSGSNIGGVVGLASSEWSVTNSAALNPVVKSPRGAGRVIGINSVRLSHGEFSNNAAYAGVKDYTGGTAWANRDASLMDGVDVAFADINNDPTIGGRFITRAVWTTEKGKLPGLHGRAAAMPEHLLNSTHPAIAHSGSVDNTVAAATIGDWLPHPYDLAYNTLMSCEENSIIFTGSDHDTYPLLALQEAYGIRTDVRVVNFALLNAGWYIKQLMNEEPRVPISFSEEEIDSLRPQSNPPQSAEQHTLHNANLTFTLPDIRRHNVLRVQDKMLLNIVDAVAWSKPIYFTLGASDGSNLMGLAPFLRVEGLVHRLMPERVTHVNSHDIDRTIAMIDSVYLLREVDESNYIARRMQVHYLQIVSDLHRLMKDLRRNNDPRYSEYMAVSLRFLNRCVEIIPWDWRPRTFRHEFYMDNGMVDEAIAAMEEAIRDDPEHRSQYEPLLHQARGRKAQD